MRDSRRHNGWSNFETWCVNLWLENNEAACFHWREQARRCLEEAPDSRLVWDENFRIEDAATSMLAERLQDVIVDKMPPRPSDVYSDLLTAALGQVNWEELAVNLLADCKATSFPDVNMPLQSTGRSFEPGRIVATPAALVAIPQLEIMAALAQHLACNWGEVCAADALENERALRSDARLLSVYTAENQTRFWIITEADRSATTVLLPSDY